MPFPNHGQFLTLLTGLAGVAVFSFLRLPLPWLLGPMFACLAVSLAGVPLQSLGQINHAFRTILGVAVGASITTALFGRIGELVVSVALVVPFLIAIGALGYPFFRRVCNFDAPTSYYAAMPGGLQDMLIFGEDAGGNARALGLIHATRVLLILAIIPFLVTFGFDVDLDRPPGVPTSSLPASQITLMVVIAIAGWRGGVAVGLFGPSLVGPLILAAAASLAGLLHSRPSAEMIFTAQYFIGVTIGAKYAGISWQELRRVVVAGIAYSLGLFAISAAFAGMAVLFGLAPWLDAILAFSAGGQSEMTVMAIVTGADVAYVVTHHLVRLVLVILCAPIVFRMLKP